jgi:hypothetical protein
MSNSIKSKINTQGGGAIDIILSRLPDARENGNGLSARCPAHEDRRVSLSIAVGDDGRVLLHCHAGCTAEAMAAGN